MKTLLAIIFGCLLLVANSAFAASGDARTRAEITALLKQFLDPAQMASASNHDRFWADDLVYTSSAGVVQSKADIMKSFESAPKPDAGAAPVFSAEDVRVRPYGDMAALTFRLVEREPDGVVSFFRNSGTFLHRKGKWQAVTWQATRVPPAAHESDTGAQASAAAVAALDTRYQAAVRANDAQTMDSILADDFVLVKGNGSTSTKADLIKAAQAKEYTYEHQEEIKQTQTVRVWGDTAVVTALLWLKGRHGSVPFDYKLWFSDTYVRTKTGWRYVFGQASLPLPASP